jgi:hypothetical protein
VLLLVAPASDTRGASATYSLNMTGAQEVPGPGDPDGTATGTITLDDVTGDLSWDITYANISAPTAMHIHGPGGSAGSGAGVYIGLNVATSGGAGTLISSLTHGTLSEVTDVLNDPTDFYVNIHNGDFSQGAIRGQLGAGVPTTPAYTKWGLVTLTLLLLLGGMAALRRTRATKPIAAT